MAAEKPKLYCSWFCPFAQRAWIALVHKGVDFEYVEQDPYNKTPEWLAVSPRGLVPAITYKGSRVYDSPICVEFVDEYWPNEPKLLPTDPFHRAHVRIWADHISKKIVPPFYQYLMRDSKEERHKAESAFLAGLLELAKAKSKDGPFFMGKQFGMVDIMLVPYTIRWDVLEHHHKFKIPDTEAYAELKQWHSDMIQVACVKKTIQPIEKLCAKYTRYADGSAKTEVADAVRKGTVLP